ncbi:hypothetical protein QBC47DRAFT_415382 [Echria macrotheca]|uniref:Uncharacterized protein n=1 Tax=Echria macrotheca TaxID=438768 RepID=A0AAJ0BA85_9PEZI|nr:hypothetical protein QBC47DRAFT_415382 [Echria macrotheca]
MAALKIAGVLLTAASLVAAVPSPPLSTSVAETTLNVDVAIVGAGASGAYAAIRLKEDFGKTIAVIEKGSKLGGHVSTYDDPVAGKPFDFGVQSFNSYGPAEAFFTRLGIEFSPAPRVPLTQRFVDFKTGKEVPYVASSNEDRTAALQKFLQVSEPFEQYLLPGYWNFPAPADIPADLLLPFGEFVAKYNISAAVNQVFEVTGMGVGDIKKRLTMYVLSAFGPPMIRTFLGNGTIFTPNSRRNVEVYEKIQARLNSSLLLGSTVVQSTRSKTGHILWVRNHAACKYTLVRAAKLLIAIEPTKDNLAPFGLDKEEKAVFDKLTYQTVHAGIVTHPSLPVDVSLVNIPAAGAPTNYVELPKPDFNSRFDYMGQGADNFRVLLVGDDKFDTRKAKDLVAKNFKDMRKKGTLPAGGPDELTFKAWSDHGAMHMHFAAKEIKAGFIQRLYALQGRTQTWWTGGAFSHQFQAVLWAFDDVLLDRMLG